MTETWVKDHFTESHLESLTPKGYKMYLDNRQTVHEDGSVMRGGGAGCFCLNRWDSSKLPARPYSSFQHLITPVDFGKIKLNIVTIYRPPDPSLVSFLDQFPSLLSDLIAMQSPFIITGDINIHLDMADDSNTKTFNEILQNYNLNQHVTAITHDLHTLDVFITPKDCKYTVDVSVSDSIADHALITATLNLDIPTTKHTTTTFRPIKKINISAFKSDLAKSDLIQKPATTASALYDQYHSVLADLLDRHAPTKTRSVSAHPPDPWITEEILEAKREKRRLERVWRHTKFPIDRKRYKTRVHTFNRLLSLSKADWYTKMIDENKDDPRKLWSSINRILHRKGTSPLPDCSDKTELADTFGNYFRDKITKIRTAFNSDEPPPPPSPTQTYLHSTKTSLLHSSH